VKGERKTPHERGKEKRWGGGSYSEIMTISSKRFGRGGESERYAVCFFCLVWKKEEKRKKKKKKKKKTTEEDYQLSLLSPENVPKRRRKKTRLPLPILPTFLPEQ